MTIDFLAGQVPTADELLALATGYVSQGAGDSLISSTTLRDSAITVPIDGPTVVDLSARYGSGGGGIRWCWKAPGTVTLTSRDIMSAGSGASTTDGTANISGIRWRQIATLTEEQVTNHFNTATTQLIRERLIVDGVGDLTWQWAQGTSNANATTINANSFATFQRLRAL